MSERHPAGPWWLALVASLASVAGHAQTGAGASTNDLGEIVVISTLRAVRAQDLPVSISTLGAQQIKDAGQQSFEDVVALVPNLNWAGDSNRPRYFQLRGIGELDQYQGAPNSSVGFLIDGIDFSGLGTAATLFDIDRIEVLRGPQATRYGANALGGLISVESAAPEQQLGARLEAGAGDYRTQSYGAVVTGPVSALDSAFRIGVNHYYTDGYYHDLYLNRWDTNRRDELTVRGRWRYEPTDDLSVDLTVLHVQIDNGYDAFTIDKSRNTQSDDPGIDAQHSTGVSLRTNYRAAPGLMLTVNGAWSKSLIKYGYDGDWGNPVLWAPYTYRYTELQYRDRQTRTLEARLATTNEHGVSWLVGAYVNDLTEGLNDASVGIYGGPNIPSEPYDTVVESAYRARNLALFGELDGELSPRVRWSLGLRGEQRQASYDGTTADYVAEVVYPANFAPTDNLWGGHAALNYIVDRDDSFYVQLARGYKAGGFNLSHGLLPSQIVFNPEWDVSLELGYKGAFAERRLTLNADVVYSTGAMRRSKPVTRAIPTTPIRSCNTPATPRAATTTGWKAN